MQNSRVRRGTNRIDRTGLYGSDLPSDYYTTLLSYPTDQPHRGYAKLRVYVASTGGFETFEATPGVYQRMKDSGVFKDKEGDLILLVHGWHAFQSSTRLFEKLLRMHSILTPNQAVVLVLWESIGANDIELGNAAWAATRLNLKDFLVGINASLTNLHCVGHSLGGHACSAICRQFRDINKFQHQCKRIVSMDPASVMFKHDSPYPDVVKYRVNKFDADYVGVLLTNRQFMGLADSVGDEYILTNLEGWNSEACPAIGKWWGKVCCVGYTNVRHCEEVDIGTMFNSGVIPHISDTCSHMMAPVQFMKFLDTRNAVPVFKLPGKMPSYINNPMLSVWSSYVTSKDFRTNGFFEKNPIWYSYQLDGKDLYAANQLVVVTDKGNTWMSAPGASHLWKWDTDKYSVYVMLMFKHWGKAGSGKVYINSGKPPKIVRLIKGLGAPQVVASRERYENVVTQAQKIYTCKHEKTYTYNYMCWQWSSQFTKAYRDMLPVVPHKYKPVPPKPGTCLPFKKLPDSLEFRDINVYANTHDVITIPWPDRLGKDFRAATMEVNQKDGSCNFELQLATYWSGCGDYFPKYGIEYLLKRNEGKLQLRMSQPGEYVLTIHFEFESRFTNIYVSEHEGDSLQRKLPPYGRIDGSERLNLCRSRRSVELAPEMNTSAPATNQEEDRPPMDDSEEMDFQDTMESSGDDAVEDVTSLPTDATYDCEDESATYADFTIYVSREEFEMLLNGTNITLYLSPPQRHSGLNREGSVLLFFSDVPTVLIMLAMLLAAVLIIVIVTAKYRGLKKRRFRYRRTPIYNPYENQVLCEVVDCNECSDS